MVNDIQSLSSQKDFIINIWQGYKYASWFNTYDITLHEIPKFHLISWFGIFWKHTVSIEFPQKLFTRELAKFRFFT